MHMEERDFESNSRFSTFGHPVILGLHYQKPQSLSSGQWSGILIKMPGGAKFEKHL